MSDEHTYKFNVSMSCGGCSGAVDRALKKLATEKPVKSIDVNLEDQTATVVVGEGLEYDEVLAKIAKTGKKVNAGFADGAEKSVEVAAA